jgi:hypothetical protein
VFKRLLRQVRLRQAVGDAGLRFYERLFSPAIALWCMVFQRLNHDHTLQAAVCNLRAGGADLLAEQGGKPPSERIRSTATAAFSKARSRLPLPLFPAVLEAQARDVWKVFGDGLWRGMRLLLMDGTQVSLRPFPGVAGGLAASSNQNGELYWVLMRAVATFCVHTGLAVASAAGPTTVSEQALACGQLLADAAGCLYLGDRNFGVFRMVRCVLAAQAHCLFRLSEPRARKIAGSEGMLRRRGDHAVSWSPSQKDLRHEGCGREAVAGRLIVAQYARPGFRPQWLYLFTTLSDATAHPADELVELYGVRWRVELDLRFLKDQMDLHHLECKTADMAEKEWMAGLMAYNLVRAVMAAAARAKGQEPARMSFSAARRFLTEWILSARSWTQVHRIWRDVMECVAAAGLPSRRKPRPPEPRAKRHKRETFPPLRGSRSAAREAVPGLVA